MSKRKSGSRKVILKTHILFNMLLKQNYLLNQKVMVCVLVSPCLTCALPFQEGKFLLSPSHFDFFRLPMKP